MWAVQRAAWQRIPLGQTWPNHIRTGTTSSSFIPIEPTRTVDSARSMWLEVRNLSVEKPNEVGGAHAG